MEGTFQVGEIFVEPGTKKCGRISVAFRPDGSLIYLPVMVVNSGKKGPVLNISSACHGDEYEGGEAIRRTWRSLNPNTLRGVFLGVPVVNVLAFESGTRTTWIDQMNLNRAFPGNPDGSITERMAYVYSKEVVSKADLVMDFHGGGNVQKMADLVIYTASSEETEIIQKERALAKATGLDLFWKGGGGSLGNVPSVGDHFVSWGETVRVEALKKGIPAITSEIGGEGRCLETVVKTFENIISNVMKSYNMVDGKPTLPSKRIIFDGKFIRCRRGGFWTQRVDLRERVKEGQTLGIVTDFFGEEVETVRAPYDGIIASRRTFPAVQPGDWALLFGKIVSE